MKIIQHTKSFAQRLSKKKNTLLCVGVFLSAVVVTASSIYLTPLRHIAVISPTMHEVDPKDFATEYFKHPEKYIFIDVRSPIIYDSAHAKGAINIPIENLYDEHYILPHSGKEIVLICTTGRLAAVAYGYLEDWGYLNLLHVQGGLQNWTYEGLPIEGKNVSVIKNAYAEPDNHQ